MTSSFRRLAWVTDIHLNFCRPPARLAFYRSLLDKNPDAILLGGDVSEAPVLVEDLREMERELKVPIFFVLGNHDYYRSTFRNVEERVRGLVRESALLRWLPELGALELVPGTGIAGHGGWADGRCGDFAGSSVEVSDYTLIGDFIGLGRWERLALLNRLGDEAAAWLRRVLPEALERFRRVIFLTHVPPFQEAAWYEGAMSHPHYLPHFSSRAVGEALLEAMRPRPDRELLVLCGHTHGSGTLQILPNLKVITGGAQYGCPAMQRVFDLESSEGTW